MDKAMPSEEIVRDAGSLLPRFTDVLLSTDKDPSPQGKRQLFAQARRTLDRVCFIREVIATSPRLALDLNASTVRGVYVRPQMDDFKTIEQALADRALGGVANIKVRGYGLPSAAWLVALQAAGIDRDPLVRVFMAANGAKLAGFARGRPTVIDIVNAYVALVDNVTESLSLLAMRHALAAARAGITVCVSTNSIATTDLKPSNEAAYPKLIKQIEGGVHVFELAEGQGWLPAKCDAIGDACLVEGSCSMDPLRELYDTDNLSVLDVPSEAAKAAAAFRENAPTVVGVDAVDGGRCAALRCRSQAVARGQARSRLALTCRKPRTGSWLRRRMDTLSAGHCLNDPHSDPRGNCLILQVM